jgi:hypothetical protein
MECHVTAFDLVLHKCQQSAHSKTKCLQVLKHNVEYEGGFVPSVGASPCEVQNLSCAKITVQSHFM